MTRIEEFGKRAAAFLRRYRASRFAVQFLEEEIVNPAYPDDAAYCDLVMAELADRHGKKHNRKVDIVLDNELGGLYGCVTCRGTRYVFKTTVRHGATYNLASACPDCMGGRVIAERWEGER